MPPIHMNRIDYSTIQLPGMQVLLRELHSNNWDVTYDKVIRKIFIFLWRLARTHSDVMFVISQLNYKDYLNNSSHAAASKYLPRPVSMEKPEYHRGEFDFLILHRKVGIIVFSVKTMGVGKATERRRGGLEHRVTTKAMKQLQKHGFVLRHLVSDQAVPPRIQQTLCFPFSTSAQFQRVLSSNQRFRQVCITE